MKLYVDDIRNAPDDSWVLCRTVQSAIKAIHQFGSQIDEISLDHDISHQVGIGVGVPRPMPCGETFQSVAHYLGRYWEGYEYRCESHGDGIDPHWEPVVMIHSANPVGAQELYNILLGYGLTAEILPLPQSNRLEMVI